MDDSSGYFLPAAKGRRNSPGVRSFVDNFNGGDVVNNGVIHRVEGEMKRNCGSFCGSASVGELRKMMVKVAIYMGLF